MLYVEPLSRKKMSFIPWHLSSIILCFTVYYQNVYFPFLSFVSRKENSDKSSRIATNCGRKIPKEYSDKTLGRNFRSCSPQMMCRNYHGFVEIFLLTIELWGFAFRFSSNDLQNYPGISEFSFRRFRFSLQWQNQIGNGILVTSVRDGLG